MDDLSPMTIVDTATWYEVWQAGIALAGMCARKGLPGRVLNFGKQYHCCRHRCLFHFQFISVKNFVSSGVVILSKRATQTRNWNGLTGRFGAQR